MLSELAAAMFRFSPMSDAWKDFATDWVGRDRLSKARTVVVAAIEGGVTLLVEAREIVADFQAMIRGKSLSDMDPWLERARSSLVASFANGVTNDKAAVCAAISAAWSNGQTEGQITKPKAPMD